MYFALKIFLFLIFFNGLLLTMAQWCNQTRTVYKTIVDWTTKQHYVTRSHLWLFTSYERQTRYHTYIKVTIRLNRFKIIRIKLFVTIQVHSYVLDDICID